MFCPINNRDVQRLSTIVIALVVLLSTAVASAQMLRLPVGEYDQEIQGYRLFTDDGKPFAPMPMCTSIYEVLPNRLKVQAIDLYGVIDLTGKVIIPFMYDDIIYCSKTTFFVKQRNKWALVSVQGDQLTDFRYSNPHPLRNWYDGFVEEDGMYGIIDSIGKEIIPPQFTGIQWSGLEGAAWVSVEKPEGVRWGKLRTNGTTLLPFVYDSVRIFSPQNGIEYFAAKRAGKWGIEVTREGSTAANVVVPHQYSAFGYPSYLGQHFRIDLQTMPSEGGRWGLVNVVLHSSTGSTIEHTTSCAVPFLYDEPFSNLSNGLLAAKKGNQWGIVDSTGKQLLPFLYDTKYLYCQAPNRYQATLRGKSVVVDSSGRDIVSRGEQYDDVSWEELYPNDFFRQNSNVPSDAPTAVLITKRGNLSGLLSTSGTVLMEPIAQRLANTSNGFIYVRKANSSYGAYINSEGKVLTEDIYDTPPSFSYGDRQWFRVPGPNGLTRVNRGSSYGVIDKTGKEILPVEYETIIFHWDTGTIMAQRPSDKGGKWSCFSGTGQAFFTDKYDSVGVENGNIGLQKLVRRNGKWGIVSLTTAEELIPPMYDSVEVVPRGRKISVVMRAWRGNQVCLVSTITHREISPSYDQMDYNWEYHYQPDFMRIQRGGKWGFIRVDSLNAGQELVPPRYDYAYHDITQAKIGSTTNAFTRVRMGTKYGYVALRGNDAGKEVVRPDYEIAGEAYVSGRRAVVIKGGEEVRLQLPVVKD